METHLADWLQGTPEGDEAQAILRSCVHCGFCTATCPTYQLLGDELDGPRGRIYLIKQVVEGASPTVATQSHLDRCLTCRGCETTCPSGVRYGHLVDIGRRVVSAQVRRPLRERLLRAALREGLTRRWLFAPAMRVGQAVRALLPASLRGMVPARRAPGAWPSRSHARKVLMPLGCVQPAMMPSVDAATARVLDALGVQAVLAGGAGCCGAIRHHLDDQAGALAQARRNIDAWWPQLAPQGGGAEAILVNASGCGAMIKDYAHQLRDDPAYADKARRVVELTRDPAEWVVAELDRALAQGQVSLRAGAPEELAFHSPCTLQHGQRVRGRVEGLLLRLGAQLQPVAQAHLCCGSAGTYSLLQPQLSRQLRARKLDALEAGRPQQLLSANVGCIAHLQAGTATPVRHWIEWLDERLTTP